MFLEHVNMTVTNLDRSVEFYADLLGYKVRWRGTTDSGTPAAHVGDDRQYIAMFQSPADGKAPNDYKSPGLNHFGLVVDGLDALLEWLKGRGIEYNLVDHYGPGRRAYFFDPDGIEVELVEY